MTAKKKRTLRGTLLMLFVGLPSFFVTVAGGLGIVAVLFLQEGSFWEWVSMSLLFSGGLAGLWGSQELSGDRDPPAVLPKVGAAVGVVTFVTFVVVMSLIE